MFKSVTFDIDLQSAHFDIVVAGRHAILAIKGATMADSGPWKLRLENKFGSDEAVIEVCLSKASHRLDEPNFIVI